jgi:hypothetical protein
MSEYQYYEFQAVDRQLTGEQMGELRRVSSRAEITPTSFVNVYNYGDFRGDPEKILEKYFDAFLYVANWGTHWLMLRMPKRLLDPRTAAAFSTGDCLSCRQRGDHVILSFQSDDEEYGGWAEGSGWLSSLLPIRTDLTRGDHRALYLGWLLALQLEEFDDATLEPPVPPGLGDLDAPLDRLADFLRIDPDLLAAAAEHSALKPDKTPSKKEIANWLSKMPAKAKDTLLARLITNDDPHLVAEVQQQAIDAARGVAPESPASQRTAAELLERARVLGETRREKEAAERAREKTKREREAAAKRKKHLESLRGKEDSLWKKIDRLIDIRQAKSYDEAVSLLRDLRDLAQMQGDARTFTARMTSLHAEYTRKRAFVKRLRKAGLVV